MGGTAFATLCLYGIYSELEWGCALASIREYETEKAAAMGLSIALSLRMARRRVLWRSGLLGTASAVGQVLPIVQVRVSWGVVL